MGFNPSVSNTSIKVCAPTFLFSAMVKNVLDRQESYLVTYFHPDELIMNKGHFLNNRIHHPNHFIRNMQVLLRLAKRRGRDVCFITASEAADRLSEGFSIQKVDKRMPASIQKSAH